MTKRIKLKMGHQYRCYEKCVIGRWNRLHNCWCTSAHHENYWSGITDTQIVRFGESLTLANLIVSISEWRSAKQANLTLYFHIFDFCTSPYCSHIIPKLHISMCATWAKGLYVLSIFDVFARGNYVKVNTNSFFL